MNAVVLYETHKGNTRQVAQAIATGLRTHGTATVRDIADPDPRIGARTDLLVVGGPTEGHGMTPTMVAFLRGLPADLVRGRAAAAFDTRVAWPKWLSGSAAKDIREELDRLGTRGPIPAESFLVSTEPHVRPGEIERAVAWGAELAQAHSRQAVPTPSR